MRQMLLPAALLALAGCATIVEGTVQPVSLSSNTPEAVCSIAQNGVEIAPPTAVPHTFELDRASGNLLVTCSAPGYETEKVALVTGKDPLTVAGHVWNGTMLLGLVDVFTGAVNEYQGTAYIPLNKS